jgi:transcription elongation factor Elf1
LYETGVKSRERRLKVSDSFNRLPRPPEQWSCVRCGHIQNLALTKLYNCAAKASESFIGMVTCLRCGAQSEDFPSFKPVNVALSDPVKDSGAEQLRQTLDSRRQWGCGEGAENVPATIHEFLYTGRKTNERKYSEVMATLLEEDRRRMPFKPSLPQETEKILSELKGTGSAEVAEYFKKPALERLHEDRPPEIRKHRETGTIELRPRKKLIPYIFTGVGQGERKAVYGETKVPKAAKKVDSDGWNAIVGHLLDEEGKRRQRLKDKTDEYHTVDAHTGQQLHKPKIPEPLVVDGKVVGVIAPRSSFDLILLKEKQRKQRKEADIKRHQMQELEELSKAQFVVAPESAAIVDEAT